jgi:MFS family permease
MTKSAPGHLLDTRRFAPLFWTQALGGFNDNLFKQAMALLVAYRAGASSGLDAASLTALAGATFVAPFIFLSAFAGTLADTMDKAVLARRLKLLELGLMVLAAGALLSGNLVFLFTVLFLLGCQAALFGPVKYALCLHTSSKKSSCPATRSWRARPLSRSCSAASLAEP